MLQDYLGVPGIVNGMPVGGIVDGGMANCLSFSSLTCMALLLARLIALTNTRELTASESAKHTLQIGMTIFMPGLPTFIQPQMNAHSPQNIPRMPINGFSFLNIWISVMIQQVRLPMPSRMQNNPKMIGMPMAIYVWVGLVETNDSVVC